MYIPERRIWAVICMELFSTANSKYNFPNELPSSILGVVDLDSRKQLSLKDLGFRFELCVTNFSFYWWIRTVLDWRNDPHTCWIISAIASYVHLKTFRCLQRDSNPWPLRCPCSALTSWPTKNTSQTFLSLIIDFVSRELMSPTNWPAHMWVASWVSWSEDHTGIEEVMGSSPVEDTWNFSGADIAEIVQQVWRSFSQFISQPHFAKISFTQKLFSLFLVLRAWSVGDLTSSGQRHGSYGQQR